MKEYFERLQKMTDEQLQAEKIAVDAQIGKIKGQVQAASTTAHLTGQFADPGWFKRANDALCFSRRESQLCQDEFGRRKRARHEKSMSMDKDYRAIKKEVVGMIVKAIRRKAVVRDGVEANPVSKNVTLLAIAAEIEDEFLPVEEVT